MPYSSGYHVYGMKNNQFIGLCSREKGSTFAKVFRRIEELKS